MINDLKYEEINVINLLSEVGKLIDKREYEKNSKTLMSQKTSRIIISALAKKDGLTQNQLVKISHMKGSTVSVCVSALEKAGYVKREKSEFDTRACNIYITDKGYRLYDKIREEEKSEKDVILKGITPKDEKDLIYFLCQMKENLIK
jgi:DNA-binding MarR family transcriptional regulator